MGVCYCQDELVGFIISYDNDIESCKGYTTFFAVRGVFRGNNIAGMLLSVLAVMQKRKVCMLWGYKHTTK